MARPFDEPCRSGNARKRRLAAFLTAAMLGTVVFASNASAIDFTGRKLVPV